MAASVVMSNLLIVCVVLVITFAALWWHARTKLEEERSAAARRRKEDEDYQQRNQRRLEMLHRLVDGIDDGLFIISRDLHVLFMNRGALRFFPPVTEPVGRTFLECVRDHRIVKLVENSSKTQQRLQQEFLVSASWAGAVGEDRVYSVETAPLPENEPAGLDRAILVILRDETDKHHLEKIRKDFVANASHELRTPLSIIIGYLENLVDGDIVGEKETRRVFSIMKKHGDRLAFIVEDLLVISRMESGQDDGLRLENFDFKACSQDVIHRLSPMTTSAGSEVTFVMDTPGEKPIVLGDRYYWDQILFNLVGNAIKENASSGVQVTIHLRQESDESVVEVRDNGVGIPQADLPFVFKRFYRVARHHSKEVKGTGLGLSIVKRAVEAHKGSITVHSRPGMETVFTMRVPRYLDGEVPVDHSASQSQESP